MKLSYEGKRKIKWLAVACAIIAVLVTVKHYFFRYGGSSDVFSESQTMFAVTVNLFDEHSESDKKLLFASLEGCGVKASFFCSADYIEGNKEEIEALVKSGNSVYLYLTVNEDQTKQQIMKYIAAENDKFFGLTGKYPMFVRTNRSPDSKTKEILTSYGQLLCNESSTIVGNTWSRGSVIELSKIDTASVCRLIEEIAKRTKDGLECVAISKLMS